MFGMSLLNTLFLWGLSAAAIPVIIHLIKRNRAVKVPFAAMRFLQIDPTQKFRSERLKQLLILLMRIIAFALLALAFARPFFKDLDTGSVWGNEQKAAVILIDNSLSMGYENTFEKARSEVNTILDSFKPGDQVTVVQFAEGVQVIGETQENPASLKSQLNRLSLTSQATNYLQALQTAETILLESPHGSKTVYLISDFQRSAWESLNPHWSMQSGININFVPLENESISNVAVTDLRISKEHESDRTGDVLARVKNHSSERKKIRISLKINDRTIARRNESLQANEEQIVQFQRVNFPAGIVYGQVDAELTESLDADNRLFFVLESSSKTQLLAVNGEYDSDPIKDELFYLERAINLPGVAKFSLVKAIPNRLDTYDFSNYRAILLANVNNLNRNALQRLTNYVRGGGGLLLSLGDKIKPSVFNRLFRDLTPASLSKPAFSTPQRDNGVIMAEVDYQHSIFRLFADPGQSDPSAAQFYQYFEAEPLTPESVLAYFDDGSPAILERKVGSGKVILLTSTLDTEWNNLPIKALFLPLLYQTLDYIVAEKKGQKSLLVGDSVPLNNTISASQRQELEIQYPSGKKVEYQNDIFTDTSEPGIYKIQRGRQTGYFAVNIDQRESDLTPIEFEELQHKAAAVASADFQNASLGSEQFVSQQEQKQKIWRFVILAVILLLIGETWLANRTYR